MVERMLFFGPRKTLSEVRSKASSKSIASASLNGITSVVTGYTSGIGLELARRMRSQSAVHSLYQELAKTNGLEQRCSISR